jgi:organic radical activating enzyme
MIIKGLVDEDFVNYRKPSMFIIFPTCTFKCDKENGCSLCQNSKLAHEPNIHISIEDIVNRYTSNPITKAIVCGGLEPLDSPEDLLGLVRTLRGQQVFDDVVIYTGYTEQEWLLMPIQSALCEYPNIIVKFGRYWPEQEPHYDEVLGVNLVSENQYAKRVSNERI